MRFRLSVIIAGIVVMSSSVGAQTAQAPLGDRVRAEALFAYPNNCQASVCPIPQTLEQTITLYLNQTLRRDGNAATTSVSVSEQDGRMVATFSGAAAASYPPALESMLSAGDSALTGARDLNRNGKWAYNWRFFLPFGLAMTNHRTVQLLHFPPDYSLEQAQDYLNSATTDRWAQLLETNGVAKGATDSYQAIIDVAPIAAPASDGSKLSAVYGAFEPYAMTMLSNWTAMNQQTGLPVVAFGGPVRDWVQQYLGQKLAVNQFATVQVDGRATPILGANHPSYIFYAAWNQACGDQPKTENFPAGMAAMRQDLISSCWQARMGANPTLSGQAVLDSCTGEWNARTNDVCQLLETTIYGKSAGDAKAICDAMPPQAVMKTAAPAIREEDLTVGR